MTIWFILLLVGAFVSVAMLSYTAGRVRAFRKYEALVIGIH